MKYLIPKLFSSVLFLLLVLRVHAQELNVNCRSIKLNISQFIESDWNSFDNQFAVKAKIIEPITISKNEIEIRIYRYGLGGNMVDVISCNQDSMGAVRYFWLNKTSKSDYTNGKGFKFVLLKDKAKLQLSRFSSWQLFMNALVKNHLTTIPGQDGINIEVLRKSPQTRISGSDGNGKTVYEIKIKDRFRMIEYYNNYDPKPDVTNYLYFTNISDIVNCLKLQ